MLTVIETTVFQRASEGIWSDEEQCEFIDWIAANPEVGDVIPGAAGLRKVRWRRSGMGKRGGARVIYFINTAQGEIWLLIAYTKAKFDNLPTSMLKQWKDALDG